MSAGESRLRLALILLIICNLLFLAYGFIGHVGSDTDAVRLTQQIAPQKIRILSAEELAKRAPQEPATIDPEAAVSQQEQGELSTQIDVSPVGAQPVKPTEEQAAFTLASNATVNGQGTPTESTAQDNNSVIKTAERSEYPYCLSWIGLNRAEVEALQVRVENSFSDLRVERVPPPSNSRWWVYVPPQPERDLLQSIARQLQEMGTSDYFFVYGNDPNSTVISLGVFTREDGARNHLQSLRRRGFNYARMGPRTPDGGYGLKAYGRHELSSLQQKSFQWLSQHAPGACR